MGRRWALEMGDRVLGDTSENVGGKRRVNECSRCQVRAREYL